MMAVRQISALPATTSSAQFSYGLHRLLPVQTVGNHVHVGFRPETVSVKGRRGLGRWPAM
jgi:hypothetical protein